MQLTETTWQALAGRGTPRSLAPLGEGRGMSAVLRRARWADGHTAVLKVSRDRRRGACELRYLRAAPETGDTPRLLGAVEEPERILLLLEDLGEAEAGDILAGVSAEVAVQVFTTLGRLHARPIPTGWAREPVRWRDTDEGVVRQLLAQQPHPWGSARLPALREAVARHRPVLDGAPAALVHADAHLDNWMFRPAPVLIDWETARVGPAAIDAARFLMEGVHRPVRRSAGEALVEAWRSQLPADTTREAAGSWLRAAVWWSLNAMIPHHATVDLGALPERMRRVHRHCMRQALDLAEDLDL